MENEEKKNQITMFQRESLGTMRTAIDEFSRPVFCLKDACDILDIKNPSDVKKRLKSTGVMRICQSDEKKFNNAIDNLECLSKSDHNKLYSPHNNQYTKGRKRAAH